MKKLLVVRAPGLSADQAVRGDMAWNVSDLIADGSFATLSGPADLEAAVAGLARDRVTVVDVPYRDAASFDGELGKLRAGAAGAQIAILSEAVFISQHFFRDLKPGATVAAADLPRLLETMLRQRLPAVKRALGAEIGPAGTPGDAVHVDLGRLEQNLAAVRGRIRAACGRAGRDPASVTLVVVTKSIPGELIGQLSRFGVADIGENRPLEALARVGGHREYRRHMIGHLQTNKVAKTLDWADVVHSVDRTRLIGELARHNKKPPVFVQVNVSGEASKGGFPPSELGAALGEARRHLEVLGLMTMAPEGVDARPHFRRLGELAREAGLPGLSMGMSQDFEAAIEEGSTHVRVGTAIFEGVLI